MDLCVRAGRIWIWYNVLSSKSSVGKLSTRAMAWGGGVPISAKHCGKRLLIVDVEAGPHDL